MLRIKLTTLSPEWPLLRQTPDASGVWEECRFLVDSPESACDWWIVYDDLPSEMEVSCPPGRTVLITSEPPALKTYPQGFVDQFDWVITCHPGLRHPRAVLHQQGLPWHVGREQQEHQNIRFSKDYNELKSLGPPKKTKLISVIASSKNSTPGHRLRLDFVEALRQRFGVRLDIFGRGHREIPDKWDGLAPYRYHIAIENSSVPHYWTEKLADPFLAGAFPIYHGCPNLAEYFPPASFAAIDIANPAAALDRIEVILQTDPAASASAAMEKARGLVLEKHQLFPLLAGFCAERITAPLLPPNPVRLLPASNFLPRRSLLRRAWSRLRSMPRPPSEP